MAQGGCPTVPKPFLNHGGRDARGLGTSADSTDTVMGEDRSGVWACKNAKIHCKTQTSEVFRINLEERCVAVPSSKEKNFIVYFGTREAQCSDGVIQQKKKIFPPPGRSPTKLPGFPQKLRGNSTLKQQTSKTNLETGSAFLRGDQVVSPNGLVEASSSPHNSRTDSAEKSNG